jgi:protein SCO1/2
VIQPNRLRAASLAVVMLALGCAREPSKDADVAPAAASAAETLAPPQAPEGATALPDSGEAVSVYDLRIVVRDQTGELRPLDSFRGHPVLITMFYAGCPNVCPLLTNDLERIDRLVPEPLRSDLRIVMVSFDAARDTPAALERLMTSRSLDHARWTLASTEEDAARELAAVLGIRFRKLDNGEFYHSTAIVLLDGDGRIRLRSEGIGKDPAPILRALH